MKKILFLVTIFGLMIPVMSAQTPTTASPTFSDKEKAEAKKELQKVGEMFGVNKQDPPPTQTKTDSKPPTMAEVADKALDMVGNAVGTIAGIVQKVAPEVWEIMVRQQYAAAFGMLVGPFLFLCLTAIYTLIVKRYWKKWPEYGEEDYFSKEWLSAKGYRATLTSGIPGILALIFTCVLAYRIGDALPMLINAKYYAVRDLLQMLLK